MKARIVPLVGDIKENAYQLGISEKVAFLALEDRVTRLLSKNFLLRQGQDIMIRARARLAKDRPTPFTKMVDAYCEGLGIEPSRYHAFLSLFEHAAHYGQTFPELKSILPGCTSYFHLEEKEVCHTRLVDFPLTGILDHDPVLYLWQGEGRPTLMNFSTPGMAPVFFHAVHASGVSVAVHHKPGTLFHREGQSIYQMIFDSLMEAKSAGDIKKELKKRESVTKWGILTLDRDGKVEVADIEGPTQKWESFSLRDTGSILFTNLPLQKDTQALTPYLQFTESREKWVRQKLKSTSDKHILDLLTDVEDQKEKNWLHPAATLSTTGALKVNLTTGYIDIKTGEGALTISDPILRFSLADQNDKKVLKKEKVPSAFESAWKRASLAQARFDDGQYDLAYHELQMAIALMPMKRWKDILSFYLCLWDFRFVSNTRELADVYKRLLTLELHENMKDQGLLLRMRMEKKLGLSPSVDARDLPAHYQEIFREEKLAMAPVFATWMNLLYPRMEILDVLTPHMKQG
ncbi:MAG: hypothetical protein V4598_02845 [Bdellovibrionota bacterium]